MMNSVAPFWDGNETWLVLGGGGLLVAFPLAYAVIMPALYLPIIIMLLGLVFRGVAFEFRWAAKPKHELWDNAFAWGSIVATFMQGVVLGGFLQGIVVQNRAFAGGPLDWFAPFPLFSGLALLVGYALLASTWLVMKTEGALAAKSRAPGEMATARGAHHDGDHQPVDTARLRAHRRSLVQLAQHPLSLAGAGARGAGGAGMLVWAANGARSDALLQRGRPVPARLSRTRDLQRALSRAARRLRFGKPPRCRNRRFSR